jgi:enterochelin esterase family protein
MAENPLADLRSARRSDTAVDMSGAYVRYFEHTSELLRDNPMGNPHVRRVPVYLPPGYDSRRRDPYPVVFMLAGWPGRGASYLADGGAFGELLVDRLDELVVGRRLPPVIVVFPDCSTRLGGSQYVNSTANGPFMDYLCEELVDWVDDRFHTHRRRDYRGLVGHSSGGFGALVTGMLRPERFGAVCCSAADCWFEQLYLAPLPGVIRVLDRAGGVAPFLQHFLSRPSPLSLSSREEVITMLVLSMCSCFAPNPQVPLLHGDLYFDLETAEAVPDVWRRFQDWDPLRTVDRHVTALKSLHAIHLEAASEDELGLHLGHRRLARKLAAQGMAHQIDEYPGRHGGHAHRMPERIGRLLGAMRVS